MKRPTKAWQTLGTQMKKPIKDLITEEQGKQGDWAYTDEETNEGLTTG